MAFFPNFASPCMHCPAAPVIQRHHRQLPSALVYIQDNGVPVTHGYGVTDDFGDFVNTGAQFDFQEM